MVGEMESWFRWLYDATGINLTIFYDPYDRERFIEGVLLTFQLSFACIGASVAIGLVGAWLQGSRFRVTNAFVRAYVALFRNTPPIVQLFFFFFVLGGIFTFQTDAGTWRLSNFAWAIISLSFYYGSFNIEIFRASVEAVPKTTVQAAEALGYTRLQTYIHVVLPLAFRFSIPTLGNNLVSLVKATSLAYAIAVPEVLHVSAEIWSDQLNVPEMMWVLLIFYVGTVGLMVYFLRWLERKLRVPGYSRGHT